MKKPFALFCLTMLVALMLDQASKHYLLEVFDLQARSPVEVNDYFWLNMAWNPGVSFGLVAQDTQTGQYVLAAFKLIVALGLALWAYKTPSRLAAFAIGLIAGGAIGNAIDRVLYGAVADFMDFHIKTETINFQWYIFNIADVAIVAGVIALMYESFFMDGSAAKSA